MYSQHEKIITLDAINVCVKDEFDVIVIGGGTSGAFAGIAAARKGLKALVIEQLGALGGSATLGLVTPLMSSHMPQFSGHCSLGDEVTDRMREIGGTGENSLLFDSTMLKFVLEDMAVESGCELLYYTTPTSVVKKGEKITHIVVYNKDGFAAYKADCFIDCTGDADIAVLSGVCCESGNHEGINQPVSLRFEMGNIDFDRFHSFMEKLGFTGKKYFAMNTPGMKELLTKSCEDGLLTKQDITYFQGFGIPGRPNAMNFNCPELSTKANVADARFLTQKQLEGKKAILRLKRFLNERVEGFENAFITEVAPFVGIRESRRIYAKYVMTICDVLGYRKFDDAITASRYPIDVHGVDDVTLGLKYDDSLPQNEQFWEVPYSCMVAKGIDNLLVSGRCAGFDFRAQSAGRVQLICRAMGEAAGIAASYAVKTGINVGDIDAVALSKEVYKRPL